jgi:hypothetical protein
MPDSSKVCRLFRSALALADRLCCDANVPRASSFLRSMTVVATVSGTATSFTDTKLSSSTTYTYRLRAGNTVGLSPYSNVISARTLR